MTGVRPLRVAQGSQATVLRISGTGLRPGLRIQEAQTAGGAATGAIRFSPVRTVSSTLAAVSVTVRRDAPPGAYGFLVISTETGGPQGLSFVIGSFTLQVTASSSLVGPAAVDTIAVLHPQEGVVIGRGERVFPRGLLGVSGSGTVTGFWELDGVPFDRFVATVRGGRPVGLAAKVPIPVSSDGVHSLTLRIDSPASAASDPVRIVSVPPQAPLMRLVTPTRDAVVATDAGAPGPVFRWTPQPGAAFYEVLVSKRPRVTASTLVFASRSVKWRPPERDLVGLGEGERWWSVRPVFPGGVPGEPVEWRGLRLVPEMPADEVARAAISPWTDSPTPLGGAVSDASGSDHRAGERRRAPGRGRVASWIGLALADDEDVGRQQPDAGEGGEGSPTPASLFDWRLDAQGTLTWIHGSDPGEEDQLRANLSGSLFREREESTVNGSANLSVLQELNDPHDLEQESRSYAFNGSTGTGTLGLEGSVGWTGPTLGAMSSFLSSGLAKAGLEAAVVTPGGTVRGYGTYSEDPAGLSSASIGSEQRLRMGGWTAPIPDELGTVEVVFSDMEDSGDVDLGLPSVEGEAYGFIGSLTPTPGVSVVAELARSDVQEAGSRAHSGDAYRLGFTAMVGSASIDAAVQETDADFANPASGSLVLGGIPNRLDANIGATWQIGEAAAAVSYRYGESGAIPDEDLGKATQHSVDGSYSTPLSESLQLSLIGNYSRDRSEETTLSPLFEVENIAMEVGLSHVLGGFSLNENVGWQGSRHSGSPGADLDDVDLITASVSGSGMVGEEWSLSTSLAWDRTSPNFGDSQQTCMASVQPSWSRNALSLDPWFSATWSEVPGAGWERSLLGQVSGAWSRPIGGAGQIGVSATAGWSELSSPGFGGDPGSTLDDWSVSATLTLSWGAGGSVTPRVTGASDVFRSVGRGVRRAALGVLGRVPVRGPYGAGRL